MSGNPKVCKTILQNLKSFSFYHLNALNKTGLYYLIGKETKKIISIFKILLDKKLDINFKPDNGNTILTDFVFDFNPNLEVIDFMLRNGADPTIMTTQNKSLYDRIEDAVKNQMFYVQSQNKIKLEIYKLFEKYKKD